MTYIADQDYQILHQKTDAAQAARIIEPEGANAVQGSLLLSPLKSIFVLTNLTIAVLFAWGTFSWFNLALMAALLLIFLWLGNSVGLHRLFIHRSFACPLWLENCLVTCGTLAGLGGPFSAIRIHDERDWAQRQPAPGLSEGTERVEGARLSTGLSEGTERGERAAALKGCHPFFAHDNNFVGDLMYQLFYRFEFTKGPIINPRAELTGPRPYLEFQERYWWAFQIFLALAVLPLGLGAVVWGVSVRLLLSLLGHWTGVYLTHRFGSIDFVQHGDAVQGRNIPAISWLTFGESMHNNHHAYPRSAKLNYTPNSHDLSYWFIQQLAKVGLAWDILTPANADQGAA